MDPIPFDEQRDIAERRTTDPRGTAVGVALFVGAGLGAGLGVVAGAVGEQTRTSR